MYYCSTTVYTVNIWVPIMYVWRQQKEVRCALMAAFFCKRPWIESYLAFQFCEVHVALFHWREFEPCFGDMSTIVHVYPTLACWLLIKKKITTNESIWIKSSFLTTTVQERRTVSSHWHTTHSSLVWVIIPFLPALFVFPLTFALQVTLGPFEKVL